MRQRRSACSTPGTSLGLWIAAAFLSLGLAACAEPPSKEMDQAQGAIDAARAAGAEQYAGAELTAAVNALQQAEAAVTASDFRLALAHALNSREQAQAAARAAVDGRARQRGDAERVRSEVETLVGRLATRLKDAEVARLPRRTLAPAQATLEAATASLQEAGTALGAGEYARVSKVLDGGAARLRASLEALDRAVAGTSRTRPR
jgi:hypothetical protein